MPLGSAVMPVHCRPLLSIVCILTLAAASPLSRYCCARINKFGQICCDEHRRGDQTKARRLYARVLPDPFRAAIRNAEAFRFDRLAIGPDRRTTAIKVLTTLLHRDMAHGVELMPAADAQGFAAWLLEQFQTEESAFYTTAIGDRIRIAEFHGHRTLGPPLTAASLRPPMDWPHASGSKTRTDLP
jgi:hypothetical protein